MLCCLLYCAVVVLCYTVLCFVVLFSVAVCHYTSVRYCCTVSSILNTSLHFTVLQLMLLLLQIWQLVLYFILLCFFQRFWSFSSFWNYLCQSHLVALFCCMFWLTWTSSSQWTIEGHEHQVSWRWWPGHKPVTTGTLSWWSEKYRFEGKHSHPFAHLFYTSLNVLTKVRLGVKTKHLGVTKMLVPLCEFPHGSRITGCLQLWLWELQPLELLHSCLTADVSSNFLVPVIIFSILLA